MIEVGIRIFCITSSSGRVTCPQSYGEQAVGRVRRLYRYLPDDKIGRPTISLKERRELLVNALNHLSGRQKETLFLRYYHGLTNQEIAGVMDINHQSVKNNIYRALKKLRGIIDSIPDAV